MERVARCAALLAAHCARRPARCVSLRPVNRVSRHTTIHRVRHTWSSTQDSAPSDRTPNLLLTDNSTSFERENNLSFDDAAMRRRRALLLLAIVTSISACLYVSSHVSSSNGEGTATPVRSRIDNDMRKRLERVQQVCDRLKKEGSVPEKLTDYTLKQLLVDDKHKMIYCAAPKVACTNWKRLFFKLKMPNAVDHFQDVPAAVAHSVSLKTLLTFSPDERTHRLNTYFKFMFARSPWERLLSAHRSKFTYGNVPYNMRYGRRIVAKYRRRPELASLQTGNDVQFVEFLRYVTDPVEETAAGLVAARGGEAAAVVANQHWAPVSDLCAPCLVRYDFIGEYGRLAEHAGKVLEMTGLSSEVGQWPNRSLHYKNAPAADLMSTKYSDVPPDLVSSVRDMFRHDVQLFGYNETPSGHI